MAGNATYKRVMCQIDSVKFYPIEARYKRGDINAAASFGPKGK